MTAKLFPRLDPLAVDQCLTALDDLVADAGRPITQERLPANTRFAAVGGSQLGFEELARLRTVILDAARSSGFPDRGTVSDRSKFDALATAALADFEALGGGEADRDDVWAFIATVLVPDVVAWRFGGKSAERFHGGVRNALQRLWMRAWALDQGAAVGRERWSLIDALTEDALVQITERPSIGADRAISTAIATAWVRTAERIGKPRMEDVMRRAVIDVRIRNEIQLLSLLPSDLLESEISAIFDRAAAMLETTEEERKVEMHGLADLPSSVQDAAGQPRDADGKTSEAVIQQAILKLMSDGRIWSNADLKDRLRDTLPLTDADRGVGARPAEELWENRVNNALGRARPSSLYSKGFVENHGVGLHGITEAGQRYIAVDGGR